MKRTVFAAATVLMIATSASAGGFAVTLPNLTFPPAGDVTVTKDCLATAPAGQTCLPQE